MGTYKDTNIQFLQEFKPTNDYFIKKDEPKIYELLKLFDGVMYHTVKAQQHFIENFKLYKEENKSEFNYLVEATYHLNYLQQEKLIEIQTIHVIQLLIKV